MLQGLNFLTIEVDCAVTVQVDLTHDVGDLLVGYGRVGLPHHSRELLDSDVPTLVGVLVTWSDSVVGTGRGNEQETHIFVEAFFEDGNLVGAQMLGGGLWRYNTC